MGRSKSAAASARSRRRPTSLPKGSPSNVFLARFGGFALLALAVLTAISLVIGDAFAGMWRDLLRTLFGWASFLSPLLFAVFGLALLWPRLQPNYRFRRREAAAWLLLFACFALVFQLMAVDTRDSLSFGGGLFGQWAALWLSGLMGTTGAFAVALLSLSLGAFVALGWGPRQFWSLLLLVLLVVIGLTRVLAKLLRALGRMLLRMGARIKRYRSAQVAPERHFRINRPEAADAVERETAPLVTVKNSEQRKEVPENGPAAGAEREAEALPDPIATARLAGGVRQWRLPSLNLLEPGGEGELSESDIQHKVQRIEDTLRDFGITASVVEVNPGPTVTQFGLDPGFRERRDRSGNVLRRDRVKVSEITALRDDIALALAARTVRIEAPVPGRAVIGLEIPNSTATVVRMRKVIETASFQRVHLRSKLAVALGQDVSGGAVAADLSKMPHLLIAGATGSGKSVCINAIITCFLLHTTPDELRLVMIDPKRVELTSFREVPHLLRSVVVDVEHAVSVLRWVLHEMETRLKRFEAQGVRNIDGYNKLMSSDGKPAMPFIVVLIDELADLMMSAPDEVERSICRLAQLARATGIHLVIATQRPSVDVVTGLIKANFPTRISFAVASQVDSRTILDAVGAEQLLGSGDMLFMPSDAAKPRRLQGVYVADEEVKRVVDHWRSQGPPQYVQELEQTAAWSRDGSGEDPMYERALDVAKQHTRVSASLLQRRLGVGYNRAARLMDMLEENGVIGAAEGGKPREVLRQIEDDLRA